MQIYYEKSDIVAKWKAPNVHPVHLQKKDAMPTQKKHQAHLKST